MKSIFCTPCQSSIVSIKVCNLNEDRKLIIGGYTSGFLVWGLFHFNKLDSFAAELNNPDDSDLLSLELTLSSKGAVLLDSAISAILFYDFLISINYNT
jgi:hypothetical protein